MKKIITTLAAVTLAAGALTGCAVTDESAGPGMCADAVEALLEVEFAPQDEVASAVNAVFEKQMACEATDYEEVWT